MFAVAPRRTRKKHLRRCSATASSPRWETRWIPRWSAEFITWWTTIFTSILDTNFPAFASDQGTIQPHLAKLNYWLFCSNLEQFFLQIGYVLFERQNWIRIPKQQNFINLQFCTGIYIVHFDHSPSFEIKFFP